MPIITLLTDFGLDDYYVAAVKGVLATRAPEAVLIDISHTVAPGDVETASFLLAAAAPTFPSGTIHLAVVDPGVGSDRRRLAATAAGQHFVAPDNGLLTPWLAPPTDPTESGAATIVTVGRDDLYRDAPGHTFDGRDRFAPIAAALACGAQISSLGDEIRDAVRLPIPRPSRTAGSLRGRVAHIDRFGNAVTDLPAAWLSAGQPFRVEVGGHSTTRRYACYSDLPVDAAGILVGSLGTLELALAGASLAERWKLSRGDLVHIRVGQAERLSLTNQG